MPTLRIGKTRHYFRLEGRPGLPALVLAHPIGADHCIWDLVLPALAQHFHVLRYDLRGHGGSELPAGECSLPQLADDLLALTSALGISRFSVGGVSLGAMVAIQAAATAPQCIDALVLCSAALRLAPPPGGWDQRAQTALTQGMAPLAAAMVARMFSPACQLGCAPFVATLKTVFTQTDPSGYAACCAVLRDADLGGLVAKVKAPSLLVYGALDPLIDAPTAQALAAALPGGQYLELDCGHYPMVELPGAFADAALRFMNAKAG
ncbi:MAG TPA: alpha/beta fold hydrolase [Burkholderiaceae bacterium]|nr:alpha/beta fold hydrolase [Burkholderiaceae bacterium]